MIGKTLRWIAVILSVVAYQGLLAEHLAPNGTGFRWDILVVLLAGMIGGTTRGILAGGMVGLVTDCLVPDFLGWGMMVNAALGAAIGMSREHLFMERPVARWIVLALGLAVHDLVYLLPVSGFDLGRYGWTLATSTTISTAITSLVGIGILIMWQMGRQSMSLLDAGRTRDSHQGQHRN